MAFAELKQRQSAAWGSGPFEDIAETLADVHDTVVDRLDPQPGERFIDLACGTGQLAERVARRGARATGVDFAPSLVETARRRAAEAGLEIDYRVGDCEDLADFDDGAFDAAASTFGVMFAPDHTASSRELARVVRPGGRITIASWSPTGTVADMFATLAQFQPPPPPEAGRPLAWGDAEYVQALLGDTFDLRFEELVSSATFESLDAQWEMFSTNFGPMRTLLDASDDEQRARVEEAWRDLSQREVQPDGTVRSDKEYLLVIGTRR